MKTTRWSAVALTLCALCSGASLFAAVLFRLPLGLTLAAFGIFAALTALAAVRIVPPSARNELGARALAGIAGGAVGVLFYDGIRLALVTTLHLQVKPFEALPLFGALIAGVTPQSLTSWIIGTLYHYLNGVMFGVSYGIALGRKSWLWGIPWALGLEAFMLMLYPGWLQIRSSMLGEFTVISLAGHLAYGTGLGLTTAALLRRSRAAST